VLHTRAVELPTLCVEKVKPLDTELSAELARTAGVKNAS
jgi:hypothetical protein